MDEWSKCLVIFYKLCSIYASYLNLCHTVPPLYSPINYGFGDLSSFVIPVAPYSQDAIRKPLTQSQKTQGFFVADFATVSDETRSRSKIFPLFIWIKEPCVRKFKGLERSNFLGFRKLNARSKLLVVSLLLVENSSFKFNTGKAKFASFLAFISG